MKISVAPDGQVTLETNGSTAKEVVEVIQQLQNSNRKQMANVVAEDLIDHSVELNASLYEAWAFLCDHDCETGLHIQGMARALKTSPGAISARMQELMKRGYALRARKGYYRAQIP